MNTLTESLKSLQRERTALVSKLADVDEALKIIAKLAGKSVKNGAAKAVAARRATWSKAARLAAAKRMKERWAKVKKEGAARL